MCIGKGFPATFGFVIAALIVIVVTQLLVLREKRQKISDDRENGAITPEEDDIRNTKVGCLISELNHQKTKGEHSRIQRQQFFSQRSPKERKTSGLLNKLLHSYRPDDHWEI